MTMDERYQHAFPWDLHISNEEFLSWEIGAFQHRTYTSQTDGQPVTYYLIRYPLLVAAPNTWRLTICPYWSQPSLYNIARNVARLYNVSELMQQLFTNAETHPIVHAHETALYLLSEQDYVTHAQMLLNNLGVNESAESVLVTFPSLSPQVPDPQIRKKTSLGRGLGFPEKYRQKGRFPSQSVRQLGVLTGH
jgi:hypothetical protein